MNDKPVGGAYNEKQNQISRHIESIKAKLEKDAQRKDLNWASVGSLTHVEELLREIDEFMTTEA
jgi:hypothetical protein